MSPERTKEFKELLEDLENAFSKGIFINFQEVKFDYKHLICGFSKNATMDKMQRVEDYLKEKYVFLQPNNVIYEISSGKSSLRFIFDPTMFYFNKEMETAFKEFMNRMRFISVLKY